MKANKFVVTGIIYDDRIPGIKQSIRSHEGVNSVRVDAQANTVTVDYDEARYSEGEIKSFISQAGLDVAKIK
jgi:copper chaperone CopZ